MAVQGPPGAAGLTGPVGPEGPRVPLDLELLLKTKYCKFFCLKLKIMLMINWCPNLQGSKGDTGLQGPKGPPGIGVAGTPV